MRVVKELAISQRAACGLIFPLLIALVSPSCRAFLAPLLFSRHRTLVIGVPELSQIPLGPFDLVRTNSSPPRFQANRTSLFSSLIDLGRLAAPSIWLIVFRQSTAENFHFVITRPLS